MYASYMQDTGSMLSLICKASSLCYTLPKQGWQLKNPGKKPASFFLTNQTCFCFCYTLQQNKVIKSSLKSQNHMNNC